MRDELRDALWNDFPTLFQGEAQYLTGTFKLTKEGVSFWCGDGWEPIVRQALERIANLGPEIRVVQIKEKLAGLTIYFSSCPKEFEDRCLEIIAEADSKAARTCEECGKPGVMREDNHQQVLCEEHAGGRLVLCRSCQGRAPRLLYELSIPPVCPDCGRQLN